MNRRVRRFELSSALQAPAEQVWADLCAGRGTVLDPGCTAWPRSTTVASRSWLMRYFQHERRVALSGSGCVVQDSVEFEPRLAFLGPWLKAAYLMRFRRFHDSLQRGQRHGHGHR